MIAVFALLLEFAKLLAYVFSCCDDVWAKSFHIQVHAFRLRGRIGNFRLLLEDRLSKWSVLGYKNLILVPYFCALSRKNDSIFSSLADLLNNTLQILRQAYELDVFPGFSLVYVTDFVFSPLTDLLLAGKLVVLLAIGVRCVLNLGSESVQSACELVLVAVAVINARLELLGSSGLQQIS